jgi:zinc protease
VRLVDTVGGVSRYRLESNGMTIVLSRSDAAPVFTFLVVYHIGSRNEAPGHTGATHLLEHLLFNKSTEHFGKANGRRTFQEVLFAAGADYSTTNMTTSYDRMTGYSTLPSDQLELAMRIEADRLGRALLLDAERQSEMSVVRNEYEIGENDPSLALEKQLVGAAIVAHPYHWDTIGYRSDIEGVSTATLREHYAKFFWPDNAEAVLVGDFDPSLALATFDRQFGGFPRSPTPFPPVVTVEPPQEGERRLDCLLRALVCRPVRQRDRDDGGIRIAKAERIRRHGRAQPGLDE